MTGMTTKTTVPGAVWMVATVELPQLWGRRKGKRMTNEQEEPVAHMIRPNPVTHRRHNR